MRAKIKLALVPFVMVMTSLLVMPPRAAIAQELCQNGASVAMNPEGVRWISQQLARLIPPTFASPAISVEVIAALKSRMEMPSVPGAIQVNGVSVELRDGALYLQGDVSLDISGPVTISRLLGTTARCTANARLPNVKFELALNVSTIQGYMRLTLLSSTVNVDEARRTVHLSECSLGQYFEAAANLMIDNLQIGSDAWLQNHAQKTLVPALERYLNDLTPRHHRVDTLGLDFRAQLESAETLGQTLHARMAVGVRPITDQLPACLAGLAIPPPPVCGLSSTQDPVATGRAMFGAGISEGIVNKSLWGLWRGGALCFDSRALKLPFVTQQIARLATILGLPQGSTISFNVLPSQPPSVKFTRGGGIAVSIDELGIQMAIETPDQLPGGLGIMVDLSVASIPWINPASNSLGLDLRGAQVSRIDIQRVDGSVSGIQFDPARIQRFVTAVVIPVLRNILDGAQLAPSVAALDTYLIEAKNITIDNGRLAAQVNVEERTTTNDRLPPETILKDPPGPLIGPQILSLRVTGSDNETRPGMLRYRSRIDGGAWTEALFGGRVEIITTHGQHLVEVAAVDLQGNTDPTPSTLTLNVDEIAPTLTIIDRPNVLQIDNSVEIVFDGQDDQTPANQLIFTVSLLRSPGNQGGAPILVQQERLRLGERRFRIEGISAGVYTVRVRVEDQAGNPSSEDMGFVIEESGCAVSGGRSRSRFPHNMVPFGLLVGLWFRRRLLRSRTANRRQDDGPHTDPVARISE